MTASSAIRIAPSILSADFTRLGEQVEMVAEAGADQIHIDVMDGRFVPNITMGPLVVEALRRVTSLPLDVHLMIERPAEHIASFAQAGADLITVHIEADPNLHRTLGAIRALGCRAGVALNPHTPASAVDHVLPELDLVIVMTVNPGFGGQSFIPTMTRKIAALRAAAPNLIITVDGGINAQTAGRVVAAGANVLVAGSSVFGHPDSPADGMAEIRRAIG